MRWRLFTIELPSSPSVPLWQPSGCIFSHQNLTTFAWSIPLCFLGKLHFDCRSRQFSTSSHLRPKWVPQKHSLHITTFWKGKALKFPTFSNHGGSPSRQPCLGRQRVGIQEIHGPGAHQRQIRGRVRHDAGEGQLHHLTWRSFVAEVSWIPKPRLEKLTLVDTTSDSI